jgi:hypothetical protein
MFSAQRVLASRDRSYQTNDSATLSYPKDFDDAIRQQTPGLKSAMAARFDRVRQLDCEWNLVEDHVSLRVEQDEIASHETILDVVR